MHLSSGVCAIIPLTRLFAIEYAALFDVINIGLGALRVSFPLGGSSNHFRVGVLREIGGWDAWNVTEDADIGLRLARFGYYAESFPASTYEEAPTGINAFLGQRRRWCKGWYQTLIVLCRDPKRLLSELGPGGCGATLLILVSYALAPLAGVPTAFLLAADIFARHLNWPSNPAEVCTATLWTSVFAAGIPAILCPTVLGMKRRGLLGLWPWLLLLPFYSVLICYAAWRSIYDVVTQPQHWHKTEHGLARSSRRASAAQAAGSRGEETRKLATSVRASFPSKRKDKAIAPILPKGGRRGRETAPISFCMARSATGPRREP